ncbi:hypothetical protein BC835DRAFT_228928 [Cytidiella melzeri]|nr:hypothetical protein BC835DRAFT_228928 [Cytidiella melzeri]
MPRAPGISALVVTKRLSSTLCLSVCCLSAFVYPAHRIISCDNRAHRASHRSNIHDLNVWHLFHQTDSMSQRKACPNDQSRRPPLLKRRACSKWPGRRWSWPGKNERALTERAVTSTGASTAIALKQLSFGFVVRTDTAGQWVVARRWPFFRAKYRQ